MKTPVQLEDISQCLTGGLQNLCNCEGVSILIYKQPITGIGTEDFLIE